MVENRVDIVSLKNQDVDEIYCNLFHQSHLAQALIEFDGTIVDINLAYASILDKSIDELLKLNISDFVLKTDKDREKSKWQQLKEGSKSIEYSTKYFKEKDGLVFLKIVANRIEFTTKKLIFLTASFMAETSNINIEHNSGLKEQYPNSKLEDNFSKFAIDNLSNIIFCLNCRGKIIYANKSACQRLGYSQSELCSLSVFDIDDSFSPITQEENWKRHWQDIQQRKSIVIESRHRTKEGNIFPVEVITNYLEFEGREYNFVQVNDIKDRKQAETILKKQYKRELIQTCQLNRKNQQLQQEIKERKYIAQKLSQSQQLLQLVLDTIPQKVFWKNRNSLYLGCNRSFAKIVGLKTPEEIIGKKDSELSWSEEKTKFLQQGDRLLMAEDRSEIGIVESFSNADGETTWLRTNKSPLHNERGEVIGILGTFQNITPLKQAEQTLQRINEELEQRVEERTRKLEESQQLLQIVMDTIPQYLFWKNRDSIYLGCNSKFARLAGFESVEKVNGKTDYDLPWNTSDANLWRESDRWVMDLDFPELMTLEPQIQADGTEIWLESHKVPLYDANGDTIGVLGTFQDIGKYKRAEESLKKLNLELQQAIEKADAANRAKSDFLANMSHELRTPLNGILGYAQILLKNNDASYKEKKIFRTIQQCGSHLLTLINDILDLSKIEAGKLELLINDFHLANFLQGIVEICRISAEKKNITFNYELPPAIPEIVRGDEKRLRQLLINLLGNAIKFTDRGQVTLKISEISREKSSSCNLPQSLLLFEVIDTGIGIAPEKLKKIFQAFEQASDRERQAEGTGLGLAIAKQLLELMNGQLYVTSNPNQGSNFWFEISLLVVSQSDVEWDRARAETEPESDTVLPHSIAPPPDEIKILYELAMLGSMKKIRERAQYLESLDERYAPLARELQELAGGFEEKAIVNLIEGYL